MKTIPVTVQHQRTTRRATLILPSSFRAGTAIPLVLGFHGGIGGSAVFERQTRFAACAERNGFAVCYPEGTVRFGSTTWNAGHCCGYAVRRNVDDVGFVLALINRLRTDHGIDQRRIYATGFSNGAMLCYRLACEAPAVFAAIAPVSGSMGQWPTGPVPLIAFHGRADRNVPYAGGQGANALQRVDHRPFEETLVEWVAVNQCPVVSGTTSETVTHRRWMRKHDTASMVEAWTLAEGGHTWPGGVDVGAMWGTGKLVSNVDATGLIWEFFKTRSKE